MLRIKIKFRSLWTMDYGLSTRKAFTLVELLVVTAILGMISATIFSVFSGGLNVYKRVQTYGGVQADVLIAFEKIERDLRNAFDSSEIKFTVSGDKISFAGLIKASDNVMEQNMSLGKISYYYDEETSALVREEQGYVDATSEFSSGSSRFQIMAFITGINFASYLVASDFGDSEKEEENMPNGVNVSITFMDSGRNGTLERLILLPMGG